MAKKAAKAPAKPEPKLTTWAAIANYAHVAERTAAAWGAAGLTKPVAPAELELWLNANRRGDRTDRRPTSKKKAKVQLRKLLAETSLVELKEQAARGEVIHVSEIITCVVPYLHAAKAILEGVPQRLLPFLKDRATFMRKAENEIAEVCNQLADATKELAQRVPPASD